MEPLEALYVGFLTSRVGVPFRGMELLASAGSHATLAALVQAQGDALRAKNSETMDGVFRVEAILGKHALAQPPRPATFDEYVTWAGAATKTAGASIPSDSVAAAALSAGASFGDVAAAAQLGVIVLTLLEAEPDHAKLREEAARLAKQLADATARLRTTLRHPALPAKARAPLDATVAAVGRAPSLDGAGPVPARLAAVRALLAEINHQLPALNAAV